MKLYIVWKTSISGWSKEIVEIFRTKENAECFIKTLRAGTQYNFTIETMTTKD